MLCEGILLMSRFDVIIIIIIKGGTMHAHTKMSFRRALELKKKLKTKIRMNHENKTKAEM